MAKTEQPPAEKPTGEVIEFVPFGAKDKLQLTIEIVKRLVAVKTKTGKSCSDEDAFRFMLMCQARKLNPFEGDAFLIGYDTQSGPSFSLITAHQAFLKRAELHPEFDGMESGTIVMRGSQVLDLLGDWHMSGDKILGGWATVYFKNRKYPMKKRLRLERFNKQYGIWKDDPAGMIVKCTEADALRSAFPTMLGGMFITEEMQRIEDIARPVFPEPPPPATAPDGKAEPKPVKAEVVERPPADQPKKKPTLTRKARSTEPAAAATPAATTDLKTLSPRARLESMLLVGKCTTDDFVALAVREGWVTPEQGAWNDIPEAKFEEFVKDENWSFIMMLLDEARAEQPHPSPDPVKSPDRLL